jgi:hypothetical protein
VHSILDQNQQTNVLYDMRRLLQICRGAGGTEDSAPQHVARFIHRIMTSLSDIEPAEPDHSHESTSEPTFSSLSDSRIIDENVAPFDWVRAYTSNIAEWSRMSSLLRPRMCCTTRPMKPIGKSAVGVPLMPRANFLNANIDTDFCGFPP